MIWPFRKKQVSVHNHAEWHALRQGDIESIHWIDDKIIHPDDTEGTSSIYIVYLQNPVPIREFYEYFFQTCPEEWGDVGCEPSSHMVYQEKGK